MSSAGHRHDRGSNHTAKVASRDGKPFSISLGGSGASKAPPSRTKPPPIRRDALRSESDSEDETDGKHELVTSFDHAAGGAITANRKGPEAPRVIASLPNKDWRAEARRLKGKNLLPAEVQAMQNGQRNGIPTTEEKPTYGLIIAERKDKVAADHEDEPMADAEEPRVATTVEDEALQALVSGADGKASNLVIAATSDIDWRTSRVSEAAAFKSDVASRPEQSTLEQYNAVPIDGFGAALLRGMGWKEGEGVGKGKRKLAPTTTKVIGKRQALLGIGAKPTATPPEELGAWGVKKGRIAAKEAYNPVVLKSKVTGEMFTEDELKARREAAQVEEQQKSSRDRDRDGDRHRDSREKDSRRDKDRLRITDGERDRSSGEKRRRDDDRDRPKSRDKDDRRKDERDRSRDRHRDKERARDRYKEKDRSRHRDRSRDDEKDKYRDRDFRDERKDKSRSHRERH